MKTEGLLNIRGKNIYVTCSGDPKSPALLYLHGGPGIGAYDFELFQAHRLSGSVYLITFDQRGCLRSDSLFEEEALSLHDLAEDCEALRSELDIPKWSVLGHSFGGYLALYYATLYPQSIETVIFESPTFDYALSARSLMRGAAKEYEKLGQPERAAACRNAADKEYGTPAQIMQACFGYALSGLGDQRENLYTYGPDKLFFDRVIAESPFPQSNWGKQQQFQSKLHAEDEIGRSILPLLSSIKCPALLLKGKHDHVTCDRHVDAFLNCIPNGRLQIFEYSGHMPRYEQPEFYAETVARFVQTHARA